MKMEMTPKAAAVAAALFLGATLALAATIAHGPGAGPVDAPGIVQNIVAEKNVVTPRQLARWIIEKNHDYQLIDIRQPWQFSDYHIPTAVNIPLEELFQPQGVKQLSRSKRIVLYGPNGGEAGQAQILLGVKDYTAYALHEGITGWWNEIMTPVSVLNSGQSPAGYLQAKQTREFFMGRANVGTKQSGVAPQVPSTPSAPAAQQPAKKHGLKLGRGC
jgi:rhodanese-related sulfurtransferase